MLPQESTSNNVSDLIKHFNKVDSDKIVNDGKSSPYGYGYGYGHDEHRRHGSQLEKSKYAHKNLGKTVHKKHGTTDGNRNHHNRPYNNKYEGYKSKSHSAPASLYDDEKVIADDNINNNSSKAEFHAYKYNRNEEQDNTNLLNKKKNQIYLGKDFEEFQKKLGYPYDNDIDSGDSDSSNSVYDSYYNNDAKGTRQSVSSDDYRSSDSTVFDEWVTDPINIKEKLINVPSGSNYSHIAQTQKILYNDEKAMKRSSSNNINNSLKDDNDMSFAENKIPNKSSQKTMKQYSPSNSYDSNASDIDERDNDWRYIPVNNYQSTKEDPTSYVKKVGKSTFYIPTPQDMESYSDKSIPHTTFQKVGKQYMINKNKKHNQPLYNVSDNELELENEHENTMLYDNLKYDDEDIDSVEKIQKIKYKSKNSPNRNEARRSQYDDDNIEQQTKEDIEPLKKYNSNEYTHDDLKVGVKSRVYNREQDGIKTSDHSQRQSYKSSGKAHMVQKPQSSSSSWANDLNKIENLSESESENARQIPFQKDNEEQKKSRSSNSNTTTSSMDTTSEKQNNVAIGMLDIMKFNKYQDNIYFNAVIADNLKHNFKNIFNKKSNQQEASVLKMLQSEAETCISDQRKMLQKEILDKHYCSDKQSEKIYCRTSALHVALLCSSEKKYCFDIIPKTRNIKKNNSTNKEKFHHMYMTMPNVYNVNALEVLLTNKIKCKKFINILNHYSDRKILTSEHIAYLLSNAFFKKINPILVQHLKNFQETKNLIELGKYYYKALLIFSVFIKPSAKIYYNRNFEKLTSWQIFDLSKELYVNFLKTIHNWSEALLQNADEEIINLSDFLFLKFLNFSHYNTKNMYRNAEGIADVKNIIEEECLFSDSCSNLSEIAFMKLSHSIVENLASINHVMKISVAN